MSNLGLPGKLVNEPQMEACIMDSHSLATSWKILLQEKLMKTRQKVQALLIFVQEVDLT